MSVQGEIDMSRKHGGQKFYFGTKLELKEKLYIGPSLHPIYKSNRQEDREQKSI